MNSIKKTLVLLLTALVVQPALLMAAPDLTGVWESEVGALEIRQDDSDLRAKQKDAGIAAELGEFMFIATLDGGHVKGKVATVIQNTSKAICGANWATWAPLELTVSADGNRLEGKWYKQQHNTTGGCPATGAEWAAIIFTRNPSIPMSDEPSPSGKKILLAALSLLGLALVFFFIRNAYVNYLVGSHKRSPNNAGLAGWGLFGGLLFGSAIGSVAIANSSMLTMPVISGLAALSLACFILCFIVSSKK